MMDTIRFMLVFLISIVVLITTEANDADSDDVFWQKRAVQAKQAARQAYQPNPQIVLDNLNKHVQK